MSWHNIASDGDAWEWCGCTAGHCTDQMGSETVHQTDGQADRQTGRKLERERQKAQGVRQGCPGREVMLPHVYLQTDRQTKHKSEDWQ